MKRTLALAFLTALLAAIAFGQPAAGGHPMMNGRQMMMRQPMMGMMDKLKLTDEQKDQLRDLHFAAQEKIIAQEAKIAELRLELQKLTASTAPEEKAINEKIESIASQEAALREVHVGVWFAFNKNLSPEQQKTWKQMLGQAMRMGRTGRAAAQGGGMGAGRNMTQCPCMR